MDKVTEWNYRGQCYILEFYSVLFNLRKVKSNKIKGNNNQDLYLMSFMSFHDQLIVIILGMQCSDYWITSEAFATK